jgi:hypothetical protein
VTTRRTPRPPRRSCPSTVARPALTRRPFAVTLEAMRRAFPFAVSVLFAACTAPVNGARDEVGAASEDAGASIDAAVDDAPGDDGGGGLDARADAAPRDAAGDAGAASPRLVGFAGIAAWSALPASERARVDAARAAFLHQSVGQDLEDGITGNGFRVAYITSADLVDAPGVSGGLFEARNGSPLAKIAEWRAFALANGPARVRVAIMKFGYADIDGDLGPIQASYASATAALRGAGVRVLHVTPPLVYDAPAANASLVAMRAWMITTFPSDVIFDLADVESVDPVSGARCARAGSWELCDRIRSTRACPSAGQGVDAPAGQGHLCEAEAIRLAKALLLAIVEAAR